MISIIPRNLVAKLAPAAKKVRIFQKAPISTTMVLKLVSDPMLQVGDWPRTKEERIKAAKKYNLIPEDYVPYEEGDALGDYPNLKAIGAFNRDPYDDYDDYFDHRFHGEVYHKDADLYYWERIDPLYDEKGYPPVWKQGLYFIMIAGSMPFLFWFFEYFNINTNHPWKQRLLHSKDQKYYEFPSPASS